MDSLSRLALAAAAMIGLTSRAAAQERPAVSLEHYRGRSHVSSTPLRTSMTSAGNDTTRICYNPSEGANGMYRFHVVPGGVTRGINPQSAALADNDEINVTELAGKTQDLSARTVGDDGTTVYEVVRFVPNCAPAGRASPPTSTPPARTHTPQPVPQPGGPTTVVINIIAPSETTPQATPPPPPPSGGTRTGPAPRAGEPTTAPSTEKSTVLYAGLAGSFTGSHNENYALSGPLNTFGLNSVLGFQNMFTRDGRYTGSVNAQLLIGGQAQFQGLDFQETRTDMTDISPSARLRLNITPGIGFSVAGAYLHRRGTEIEHHQNLGSNTVKTSTACGGLYLGDAVQSTDATFCLRHSGQLDNSMTNLRDFIVSYHREGALAGIHRIGYEAQARFTLGGPVVADPSQTHKEYALDVRASIPVSSVIAITPIASVQRSTGANTQTDVTLGVGVQLTHK